VTQAQCSSGFSGFLHLLQNRVPWGCTVKKNSPGDCFLGARCEDGYQNQQDFGRQAVKIRQKADLCPSAPAKIQDITFRGVLFLLFQNPL